jgi:hypothetical protein
MLLLYASLISAVFIRLLPALLVAPRNFAPRNNSCHCIASCSAARQRDQQA